MYPFIYFILFWPHISGLLILRWPFGRAAVGMGIPMGIPMGMGMVWVWGL